MWVEVDHGKVATSFNKYDKIRVVIDDGFDYEGLFIKCEGKGPYVHLTQPDSDYPVCLYVWPGRKFYKWAEDKPVDESKLRLNKPDPDQHPDTQAEVEEAEAALKRRVRAIDDFIKDQVRIEVGRQAYILKPGDHLRVWWEDGALWSELVQEK